MKATMLGAQLLIRGVFLKSRGVKLSDCDTVAPDTFDQKGKLFDVAVTSFSMADAICTGH